MKNTILLVDDHALFRKGLRLLLEEEQDMEVVGEAGDGQEAIDRVRELSPDVVVMDITMPGLSGIDATRQILQAFPDTRIVALSIHSGRRFVKDMLQAGAAGYILKESAPEELLMGVRAVIRGDRFLSASITGVVVSEYMDALSQSRTPGERPGLSTFEKEFIDLLIDGASLKRIAAILKLDSKEATSTRKQILKKLGAGNMEALRALVRTGVLEPDPLLITKFHHPTIASDMLPRNRLLAKIKQGGSVPLTLISAPAGYGKSMLASAWLKTVDMPNAWISLDEGDNDPRLFLAYVLKALESMFPGALSKTKTLLKQHSLPLLPIIAKHLLNDLDAIDDEFILVMDDCHHVTDKDIHGLLNALLRHPPPTMHLVLVTRRDPPLPLSSLRASGQVIEISTKDLRFSRAETVTFIQRLLNVSIDDEIAAVLDEKIEGWVTGLRLAALSMHGQKDLGRLIKGFKTGVQYITEYLLGEVLLEQPDDRVQYLMKTSIVNRFCPELCEAIQYPEGVIADHGTSGKAFIEWLERANLFLTPLDEKQRWFRYHRLFQQLLQNQLRRNYSSEEIKALYSRASAFFASRGFLVEAVQHALSAGDSAKAAALFEEKRQHLLNNDQRYAIEKGLSLFPDKIVQSQPTLLLAKAWVLYHRFQYRAILPIIETVEALLPDHADRKALSGELAFFRSHCAYLLNQSQVNLTHLQNAQEKIPDTHHEIRGHVEILLGLSQQMKGQKDAAVQLLRDRLHQRPSPHDLRKTRLMVALVYIHIIAGELLEAFSVNQRILEVADESHYIYTKAWGNYLRGLIHFYRNEMEAAIHRFGLAFEERRILHTRVAVDCMAGMIIAYQFTQQAEKATAMLTSLSEVVQSMRNPSYTQIVQSCQARLSIMRGQPEQAIQLLEQNQSSGAEIMIWWLEIPSITFCRVQLADGSDQRLKTAEEKLQQHLQMNQDHHNACQMIPILLLLSLIYEKQGRPEEAATTVERALSLAEPGGFIFPFVELGQPMSKLLQRVIENNVATNHVHKILAAFSADLTISGPDEGKTDDVSPPPAVGTSSVSQPLVEPLTNRELDILELLAKRLSNKEIAGKLFISTETVKTHLSNIYQKLAVGNRRQAVVKAGELGII